MKYILYLLLSCGLTVSGAQKPNVILIMADDLGVEGTKTHLIQLTYQKHVPPISSPGPNTSVLISTNF